MSKYADIIERLEKATGPDPHLDSAIYFALFETLSFPSYTSSLDAAIALVERMLPGGGRIIEKSRLTISEPLYSASLYDSYMMTGIPTNVIAEGEHEHCEAIALLIALFCALESQEVQP